jgi:hypothetical protein
MIKTFKNNTCQLSLYRVCHIKASKISIQFEKAARLMRNSEKAPHVQFEIPARLMPISKKAPHVQFETAARLMS